MLKSYGECLLPSTPPPWCLCTFRAKKCKIWVERSGKIQEIGFAGRENEERAAKGNTELGWQKQS